MLYIYDATGIKLKKIADDSGSLTVTEYAGNFIYEGPSGNIQLKFFSQPEGYISPDGQGGYEYIYQYKDHLGNIRLSYTDINRNNANPVSLEIVEENNYYPFGLKHKGYNELNSPYGNNTAQRWKFGGKELDNSLDGALHTYDFGARNYDPAIGRWMNMDPLAEMMRRHSPYNYAFDNPVFFTDPDGMAPTDGYGNEISATSSSYVADKYEVTYESGDKVKMTSYQYKKNILSNDDCPPGVNCEDPLPETEVVSSGSSGKKGGTFGKTRSGGKFHGGLDLKASKGTELKAPLPGKVVYAKNNHESDEYSGSRRKGVSKYPTTGYGNVIVIQYSIETPFEIDGKDGPVMLERGQNVFIRFTHLDNVNEELFGETVEIGDVIGTTGATGNPGLYNGQWGIAIGNRHTHMEVSTELHKDGSIPKSALINPAIFIKTEIDKNGNVIN